MDYFKVELLDPEKLIKLNELKEITNPIVFIRDNIPSDDGLLSNEIFGITKDDRANIFAYINLGEYFINPLIYKMWSRVDRRIRSIVYGTKKYRVVSGDFVEDEENGETGIKFLKDNMDKIKIKSTESVKRDVKIQLINENKDKIFINNFVIIPAYYRDVNTSDKGFTGIGDINKLYNSLLMSVRSIKETADYGISLSDTIRGRIQETILNIYNWFVNGTVNGQSVGNGLSHKQGIVRRSVLSKTADYASRLVISAPRVDVETYKDLMVNLDYAAVPLASACVNLYPFVIFNMRRFFEVQFSNLRYPIMNKKGELDYVTVKDPQIEFSDERLKKEIDRFIKGYSNRFIPIGIPNEEGKNIFMKFKGRSSMDNLENNMATSMVNRRLTWCDVIYMACVESAKEKHALVSRYPVDDYFGQVPMKMVISSTKETEPLYIDGTFYPIYPKIREEDILQESSNKFIDTMNMSNLYLSGMGGDYDGDQVTVKVAYTREANDELEVYMNSKFNYITIGGTNIKTSNKEALHVVYCLTVVPKDVKLTKPIF